MPHSDIMRIPPQQRCSMPSSHAHTALGRLLLRMLSLSMSSLGLLSLGLLSLGLLSLGACTGDKVITPIQPHPAKTGPLQSTSPNTPTPGP